MSDLDLTRTKAAVTVWRAAQDGLDAQLRTAQTDADVVAMLEASEKVDSALRDAFYEDTKDRNQRKTLNSMHPFDIVRFAETGSFR